MLLEFMASLFGSVQALLPLYARDILGVGAWGAGLLRSATALGGLLAAAVLTRRPIKSDGGLWLFGSFALLGSGDHRVRLLDQPGALDRGADGSRHRRPDRDRDPADADPDADAGRDARPRVLGELVVLRHVVADRRSSAPASPRNGSARSLRSRSAARRLSARWRCGRGCSRALRRVDNPGAGGTGRSDGRSAGGCSAEASSMITDLGRILTNAQIECPLLKGQSGHQPTIAERSRFVSAHCQVALNASRCCGRRAPGSRALPSPRQ